MIINDIKTLNLIENKDAYLTYDEEDTCPICKSKISPKYLSSVLFLKDDDIKASIHYFCNGCNSTFITTYNAAFRSGSPSVKYYNTKQKISSDPQEFIPYTFDNSIKDLSPKFVTIYNQALAAESCHLNEIAGLGFRKALEFLIKDFAISENQSDEEIIKSMMLSSCIKKYIDDPRIKTLAEKSAWIGNDEAHYIRKQDDRDVSDMKAFIKATVYFISMVLITKDADSIESK